MSTRLLEGQDSQAGRNNSRNTNCLVSFCWQHHKCHFQMSCSFKAFYNNGFLDRAIYNESTKTYGQQTGNFDYKRRKKYSARYVKSIFLADKFSTLDVFSFSHIGWLSLKLFSYFAVFSISNILFVLFSSKTFLMRNCFVFQTHTTLKSTVIFPTHNRTFL